MFAGRSSSLSSQIVADVRDALFGKKLKPGDFLGTEKDLAAKHGVELIKNGAGENGEDDQGDDLQTVRSRSAKMTRPGEER